MEESDAWWVYQNQEPLVTSLETVDARCSKFQGILQKYGIRCVCSLPLTTAHSKVGTLTFASKAPDIYTAEEVCFLSVVADQIALAFDNALHFEAAQASQQQLLKKNERLELLLELTNYVVANLEFRDLLRAAVASTRRVMGCDGVGITLPDTDSAHLRIYALDFPASDEAFHEESLVPIDEDLSGEVFRTGKLWCGSVQEARRLGMKDTSQAEVGKVYILPLVSRDRVLGTFGVVKYQDNAFSSEDIEFLTQIANQVAIAVENACAFGQIRELRDKLAQEKLYLEDEIRSEMNFAQIVGKSASLRRARNQLLSGTGVSIDEYRRLCRSDRLHLLQHTSQGSTLSDDLREIHLAADFAFEIEFFLRELVSQLSHLSKSACILDCNGNLICDLR